MFGWIPFHEWTHRVRRTKPMSEQAGEGYLCPNMRVDLVSASLYTEGEQQMMMVVRQLPPRESCRMRVILLSRYGTWLF